MKRLNEFNLTEQEIWKIFSSQEDYEFFLAWYDKNPNTNSEKTKIARVLFLRGKREESSKLLESIEDARIREESLQWYASWCAEPGWIVN